MVVYPTSLVLRIARTVQTTLAAMRDGLLTKPLEPEEAMGFDEYKSTLRFEEWTGWGSGGAGSAAAAAAGTPPCPAVGEVKKKRAREEEGDGR